MYEVVAEHVFPWLRTLGDGTTYATHMEGARFTIPTPAMLAKAVDGLDAVPMVDRDTKGDVYEYMLAKIASAGQNGQFRTPRHIIALMVEMTAPAPGDTICDPAVGTAGFLVAASKYVRGHHPEVLRDPKLSAHFHHGMFNGYDFDNTMLRIASMNMLLHGVDSADNAYKDSLAEEHAGDEEAYSLILANPRFAGSLDYENTAKDHPQRREDLLALRRRGRRHGLEPPPPGPGAVMDRHVPRLQLVAGSATDPSLGRGSLRLLDTGGRCRGMDHATELTIDCRDTDGRPVPFAEAVRAVYDGTAATGDFTTTLQISPHAPGSPRRR